MFLNSHFSASFLSLARIHPQAHAFFLSFSLLVSFIPYIFFLSRLVHAERDIEILSPFHARFLKNAYALPLRRISHLSFSLSLSVSRIIVIFVSEHNAFTHDVRKLRLLYFPAASTCSKDLVIKFPRERALRANFFKGRSTCDSR